MVPKTAQTINATSHEERTYGELANQVVAVHAALESLGLCAGDKLCLIVANRLELLPIFLGAACANVGVAYDYPGYAIEVLTEWMKDIEFTAICCEPSNIDSALELKARLPTIKRIISLGEPTSVPHGAEGAVVLWSELIKMGTVACSLAAPSVEYQMNRICYMNSTSGTTGKPKMVVHYHDSLVASVQANSHRQHMGLTLEDVVLCTGSLGHVYALFDCACKAIVQGATCAFLEEANADALLEALQRFKVTALSTVPYLARGLLDHPQRSRYDLSRLQYVATGSNYISEDVARRLFYELHLKSYIQSLPHPQAGQLPHAVIVPKNESKHLGLEHYITFVNERVPKQLQLEGGVTLVDSIPRNKIGKLVRRELLNMVLELRTRKHLK
ncbi:hypothetical protein HPB49_004298 [Dermacentor silvarum]|uniref:Uncharacterized protein n=1 Tax=Dermacentor silvarum TaxID=543639 RepID=A0ACB8DUP5_DERSI|nr:hypothetical protein HPB49_004298 [Dermacentor silvarum]